MKRHGAFVLAAMLALSACAGALTPSERQTTTTAPAARPAPVASRPAPRAQPAPPAVKPRISDLLGRETALIDAQIGGPDLVRREGDGEIRIYRTAACVLHVFAYPRNGVRQATHIEARTAAGQIIGAAADDCLASFAGS